MLLQPVIDCDAVKRITSGAVKMDDDITGDTFQRIVDIRSRNGILPIRITDQSIDGQFRVPGRFITDCLEFALNPLQLLNIRLIFKRLEIFLLGQSTHYPPHPLPRRMLPLSDSSSLLHTHQGPDCPQAHPLALF
ncbi:hypothetical protein D3C73_1276580 [compost metagenome]